MILFLFYFVSTVLEIASIYRWNKIFNCESPLVSILNTFQVWWDPSREDCIPWFHVPVSNNNMTLSSLYENQVKCTATAWFSESFLPIQTARETMDAFKVISKWHFPLMTWKHPNLLPDPCILSKTPMAALWNRWGWDLHADWASRWGTHELI